MNETLCRALLRARLSDEDVAARLEVDPKTVRRWLDGRVPYLRHRWAIALLVGMDEADLWPQLRAARARPGEVVAVYPHRDSIPPEAWSDLFASATREAGVLADREFLLADDSAILGVLAERARSGIRVRVCLAGPATSEIPERAPENGHSSAVPAIQHALGPAEFRLHGIRSYNSIAYADDQVLAAQHVYGLPDGQAPVLHLRGGADQDMVAAYLTSFERIWADARAPD